MDFTLQTTGIYQLILYKTSRFDLNLMTKFNPKS